MDIVKHWMRTAAIRLGGPVRTVSGKSGRISEGEMTELDFAARLGPHRDFCAAIIDIRLGGEDVIQPAHGSGAALKDISDPSQGDHGPDEQGEVTVEGNERAKGDLAAEKLMAALPKHDQKGRADERLKRRHKHAPGADEADVPRDILAAGLVDASDFRNFLMVRAHQPHARN